MNSKSVCMVAFFLLLNFLFVSLCLAEMQVQDGTMIGGDLYLEVYENQKMTGEKIIAHVFILYRDGVWKVDWRQIYITPFHEWKKVSLKMESFTSDEGLIKDFHFNENNTITFQLLPSAALSLGAYNVQLKLSGENSHQIIDMSSQRVVWDKASNEKDVTEWKRAEKSDFELPYTTVF